MQRKRENMRVRESLVVLRCCQPAAKLDDLGAGSGKIHAALDLGAFLTVLPDGRRDAGTSQRLANVFHRPGRSWPSDLPAAARSTPTPSSRLSAPPFSRYLSARSRRWPS